MLSFKNFIRRLKSPFTYNIGFVAITPAELIADGGFGDRRIEWLRHGYNDRWFADPFILDVNDAEIVVLAEEKVYGRPGTLVKLVVARKTKKLQARIPILELDTHLSYPVIRRENDKVYVYPENGQSGRLNLYEFGPDGMLHLVKTLIDQPLNDSTIYEDRTGGSLYLLATNTDIDCHNHALLYKAQRLEGPWRPCGENPVASDIRMARPGGGFFRVGDRVYRPAQDCQGEYGNSIHVMEIESFEPYREKEIMHIKPSSFKYSRGLHTLNFHDSGVAVIDGNGYAYPIAGRICGDLVERICHPRG